MVDLVKAVFRRMSAHHWAIIGAQMAVFAGLLEEVHTWRGLGILIVGQAGVLIAALSADSLRGRDQWTPEQRAEFTKRL